MIIFNLPGGIDPYITATSCPFFSRMLVTLNMSFLLKQTIQSPGSTASNVSRALYVFI